MNTKIAIKGHKTRCKEVIEILEMLGGINTHNLYGDENYAYYTIDSDNEIKAGIYVFGDEELLSFTIEEFLEKYPYKVGDRVRIPEYESEVCISKMLWNGNEVLYEVVVDDEVERYSAEELNEFNEPNKEEVMETITIDDFKANTKEWLIDKLHDMVISKAIKTIGDIHEKLHKPQYPKTYKECCEVLCCKPIICFAGLDDDEEILYGKFIALKRCRDAYWKIAGKQMGLGKPWEPDWGNLSTSHEFITINKGCFAYSSKVLVFPTKEIQDMFYENFKELIESCKDFL